MSALLTSDWVVLWSDRAGFRMFPGVPSVCGGRNTVRVPPRAQCYRRSEGFWASECAQIFFYRPLRGLFYVAGRLISFGWAGCLCSFFFMVGWARGYMTYDRLVARIRGPDTVSASKAPWLWPVIGQSLFSCLVVQGSFCIDSTLTSRPQPGQDPHEVWPGLPFRRPPRRDRQQCGEREGRR
jgi:hypothetical protein